MKKFLKGFKKRNGIIVSVSLLIQRFSTLISSIYIANFLSKEHYGYFTYTYAILGLIMPFLGLGLNHSLLYFGSDINADKKQLFGYSLKKGTINNFFIVFIIILSSSVLTYKLPDSRNLLIFFTIYLITNYFHILSNNFYRINEKNNLFAWNNIIRVGIFLGVMFVSVPYLGVYGYVLAFIVSPIYSVFYSFKYFFGKYVVARRKEILMYGLNVGLGSIISQIILMSDNIIIGNLVSDPAQIAVYKVGSIIPMGLLFIPSIFLTTDFVEISKNKEDKKKIKEYYMNFVKLFMPLSILIFMVTYFFCDPIILALFGEEYLDSAPVFKILMIGVTSVFFLRTPVGFILNALGEARINVKVSYFMLFVNIILSVTLTLNMGIKGAAIASCLTFWIGGFVSLYFFTRWLKN